MDCSPRATSPSEKGVGMKLVRTIGAGRKSRKRRITRNENAKMTERVQETSRSGGRHKHKAVITVFLLKEILISLEESIEISLEISCDVLYFNLKEM